MGTYLQPNILIPVLIALVAGAFYYFYLKINKRYPRKKHKKEGEDEVEGEIGNGEQVFEPISARIADNTLGRIYNATIPVEEVKKIIETHKTLGRRWTRDGKQIYAMVKLKDNTYKPIILPSQISNAPSELHNDMKQPEIEVLFDMREEKSFFEKYGQILWWVLVMGFLMFLWSQS